MSTQTVPQNAIVNAVKGEVLVLGLDGKVRSIKAGDELISGEVIITENNASLDVQIHNELYLVDANCVACLPEPSFEQPETLLQSPVNGQVTFDPTSIEGANFDANDVAAIQQAILDGADPTAILEATAAGAGAEGSANAGYVTVEYNNPEVLASTFFETSAGLNRLGAHYTELGSNCQTRAPHSRPAAPARDLTRILVFSSSLGGDVR